MQDTFFDDPEGTPPGTGAKDFALLVLRWAGAVLSLGLIVGIVTWGYRLAVRDPADVPVIRAVEGPMRTQPEEAGGVQAAHQGLEVNRVLEGEGAQTESAEALAPAPEALAPEDVPQGDLTPEQDVAAATPPPGDGDTPEGDDPAGAAISLPEPPPSVATRPRPRPEGLAEAIPPARRQVIQLGSFDSREEAETEWAVQLTQHADLLGGKEHYVEEAASGGQTYYRLRAAGFETGDETFAMCEALKAREVNCTPVVER